MRQAATYPLIWIVLFSSSYILSYPFLKPSIKVLPYYLSKPKNVLKIPPYKGNKVVKNLPYQFPQWENLKLFEKSYLRNKVPKRD